MAEDDHRPGWLLLEQLEEAGGPAADVFDRLATRTAVAPEVPVRILGVDLPAGDALIVAVVPLHQERLRDRVRVAGKLRRVACALERAGVDGVEPLIAQPGLQGARPRFALGQERHVGAAGVAARLAPVGLAMASQKDV